MKSTATVWGFASVVALSGVFVVTDAWGGKGDGTVFRPIPPAVSVAGVSATATCGTELRATLDVTNLRGEALSGTLSIGSTAVPFTVLGTKTQRVSVVQKPCADGVLCTNENIVTACTTPIAPVTVLVKDRLGAELARKTLKPTGLYVSGFKNTVSGSTFMVTAGDVTCGKPLTLTTETLAGSTAYAGTVTLMQGSVSKQFTLNAAPATVAKSSFVGANLDCIKAGIPKLTYAFSPGPSGSLTPQNVTYAFE